jgi:hypothetical protein
VTALAIGAAAVTALATRAPLTVRTLPDGGTTRRGTELTFGGDPGLVDVPFPDARLPGLLGRVGAGPRYWSVSNYSADTPLVVEDARDGQGYARVRPGAHAVPVPFAHARVVILSSVGIVGFTVDSEGQPDPGVLPGSPPLLDSTAKYFAVLVALCEPALRYGSAALIPTSPQVAQALANVAGCRGITVPAVQYHVHYLLNVKLRTQVDHHCALRGAPRPGRRDQYRRAVLVDLALRFGLVRPAHLRLLAPVPAAAPAG